MTESNQTLVNLLAGATQATLVTIVGYPFDLIKSRMQTGSYLSTMHCIRDTVSTEGVTALYRGATAPWVSHLLKRPIQYPIAEWLKNRMPGTSNNYLIGGLTGAIGPLFGTPLQVIKVGMQTSRVGDHTTSVYIRNILERNGISGMYRGLLPTVMKDTLFGASFIGHYYTLRDYFSDSSRPDWIINIPMPYKTFISGAAAHCATWLLLIPIDTIKTKVQSSNETRSLYQIVLTTVKHDGVLALWRGVLPACLRTIPVSGVAMIGYESIRSYFK